MACRLRVALAAWLSLVLMAGWAALPGEASADDYYDQVMSTPGLVAYYRLGEPPSSTMGVDEKGGLLLSFPSPGGGMYGVTLGVPGLVASENTAMQVGMALGAVSVRPPIGTGDFTIEAWYKASEFTGSGRIDGVVLITQEMGFGVVDAPEGPQVHFELFDTNEDLALSLTADAPLQAGRPHHFVVTYGNNTVKLYVDGELVASEAVSLTRGAGSALLIGEGSMGGGFVLDEVALYNQALGENEIASHSEYAAIPPSMRITSSPSLKAASSSATFEFEPGVSMPGLSFECRLDGGAWQACTSPVLYDDLADGQHTFQVRAVLAGVGAGDPETYEWTVDTTPPQTTITSGPAAPPRPRRIPPPSSSPLKPVSFECRDWEVCNPVYGVQKRTPGRASASPAFFCRPQGGRRQAVTVWWGRSARTSSSEVHPRAWCIARAGRAPVAVRHPTERTGS